MHNRFRFWLTAFIVILGCFLAACQSPHVAEPRAAVPTKKVPQGDLLWHFVHDQCLPNQLAGKNRPLPCIHVDPTAGFVIFKDRNGPLQYLHMPTRHISGLEDPVLRTMPRTPYFAQAWHARTYLDKLLGSPIAPALSTRLL